MKKNNFVESYNQIFNPGLDLLSNNTEKKNDTKPTDRLKPIVDIPLDHSKQLNLDLDIPKTLRSEFNFLKFPFFDLAKNSRREKIEIEEEVRTREGWGRVYWKVARSIDRHFPGDFEKRLHRAVEQILNAMPKPIQNPVRLGSLRYIAKLMGINPNSGKNIKDIQNGLKNIKGVTIEAEGSFRLKGEKRAEHKNDSFNLYNRVVLVGQTLPDGSVADAVYLELGTWYLQNINNNYVVPLDWQYYNQLKGTITTRLYEMLSIYFYAALERKEDSYEINYSRLCDYLPVKRMYPKWLAKKQLKSAHDILVESQYFSSVEWMETHEPNDWRLRYWIGERARGEYEKNKTEMRTTLRLPARRRSLSPQMTFSEPSGSPLWRVLTEEWKIGHKKAKALIQSHPEPYLEERIDFVTQVLEREGKKETKPQKAGYLINWLDDPEREFPSWFESRAERKRKAKRIRINKKRQEIAELQGEQREIEKFLDKRKEDQLQDLCAENWWWFKETHGTLPNPTSQKDRQILEDRAREVFDEMVAKKQKRYEYLQERIAVLRKEIADDN